MGLFKFKFVLLFLLSFSLLWLFPSGAFAVTVNISDVSSTVSSNPFTIEVTLSGAQAGKNYLRANFFKEGTISYFGYTYNGSLFYNGSDYSQYFPITVDSSGSWSGEIQAKVDKESNFYKGPGSYNLKVRRYTQSGSTYIWSNEVTVNVEESGGFQPTPSPSSISTPSPESTLVPKSTFEIKTNQSVLNEPDFMEVQVYAEGLDPDIQYFLKGAFKKADSSNYFGKTEVLGVWVKNSQKYLGQLPIISDPDGKFNGTLRVMIDTEDSGFTEDGDYVFKVGRYTNAGSGPTWSNQINIGLTGNPQSVDLDSKGPANTSLSKPQVDSKSQNQPAQKAEVKIPYIRDAGATVAGESKKESIKTGQSSKFNIKLIISAFLTLALGIGLLVYSLKKSYHIHYGIFKSFGERYSKICSKIIKKIQK